MRILVFSQYFTPEVTAARARLHPIAKHLAERGHEVEVICEVPNHPEGVILDEFRRRAVVRREFEGFSVRYVWVSTSPVKTTWSRMRFYGSYALMASLIGCTSRRPDVIFVSSPPLPAAAAAAVAAKRFRVPWVFDVRDPWPEAAVALGELTSPSVIRAAEWLERRLYASAAAIVTVTEPFRADIATRTPNPAKIAVIPNGTTRLWLDAGAVDPDRSEFQLPTDRFVWTYAGNVGIAQGLEIAVDAAALLGDGFELMVVGSGPVLDQIRRRAEDRAPGRVSFKGLLQPEQAARFLRASDALLVPLAVKPELRKFVPSKLFDCCAVGRPVIVAADGEAARLAKASEAALVVPAGDAGALADGLRRLRDDVDLRERFSERGREFAARFLREDQIGNLEDLLASVARG